MVLWMMSRVSTRPADPAILGMTLENQASGLFVQSHQVLCGIISDKKSVELAKKELYMTVFGFAGQNLILRFPASSREEMESKMRLQMNEIVLEIALAPWKNPVLCQQDWYRKVKENRMSGTQRSERVE